jgi:hypothetical protein
VKDKNGNLHANSHNILNRWKNYSYLLNVHGVSDVRQINMYAADPPVPEPSHFILKLLLQSSEVMSLGTDKIMTADSSRRSNITTYDP